MKTVIEMAKEAGPLISTPFNTWCERFAELVRADEREECAKTRAAKPRELKPVGRGAFLDEQQFCFDKGWREGAASVRAAIRARSNT
jgi:hypothetical protein